MHLLAIDTGQAACSVALWREGEIAGRRYRDMPKGHAEALIPMIDELKSETAFEFSELDALAVTIGPGTFTGLRVGLSTARALAQAASKPLVGVNTLEAIAEGVTGEAGQAIAAAFDARRNEIYLQLFSADRAALTEPALISLDQVAEHIAADRVTCVGTGSGLVADRLREAGREVALSGAPPLPDAALVAAIAARRGVSDLSLPGPLYLRAPDAKLPSRVL